MSREHDLVISRRTNFPTKIANFLYVLLICEKAVRDIEITSTNSYKESGYVIGKQMHAFLSYDTRFTRSVDEIIKLFRKSDTIIKLCCEVFLINNIQR